MLIAILATVVGGLFDGPVAQEPPTTSAQLRAAAHVVGNSAKGFESVGLVAGANQNVSSKQCARPDTSVCAETVSSVLLSGGRVAARTAPMANGQANSVTIVFTRDSVAWSVCDPLTACIEVECSPEAMSKTSGSYQRVLLQCARFGRVSVPTASTSTLEQVSP